MHANLLAKLVAIALLCVSMPALATFHLIKVVEFFPGTAVSPNAQYIVLQMEASGQNIVAGHSLTVYNAGGTLMGTLTFPGNVANGSSQAKILIATASAETFFGLAADLRMDPCSTIIYFECIPWVFSRGGKACWAGTLDCVAWGGYTGSTTGAGPLLDPTGGVPFGTAAIRRLDIAGSPTLLDAADDTDDSAHDFILGRPAPRNNAGMLGTIPAAACGNGTLEGLEQCDDGNPTSGDGCSSTCASEAPSVRRSSGDYDGDGVSDVLWRNTSTGGNAIWKSANDATPQTVVGVSNQSWKVVGKGDFDADGKADILWRNAATGANTVWKSGNAATPLAMASVGNPDWQIIGAGDFDGDGRADILWRNSGNGANAIWKSANYATPQPMVGVTNLAWKIAGIGDFNHDGKSDVFWRNAATGANALWLSANASTSQPVAGVSNLGWRVAGIGDFDGDGASDVFWRNRDTGANAIWNSADAATSQVVVAVSNADWMIVAVGDFDGDGESDAFWRNSRSGSNAIWNSANAATSRSVAAVLNLAWSVAA
jgi:cysteine-rich repeat protein